jgi:blue copper oxidase
MNRRNFLGKARILLSIPFISIINACGGSADITTGTTADTDTAIDTLTIPPEVRPDGSNNIGLQANEGTTEFYSGVSSATKGFVDTNNSAGTSYLAPTIRVSNSNVNSTANGTQMVDQGTQSSGATNVNFTIVNNTTQTITSHWHGLHVDGFFDGGPYNAIATGGTWSPTLPIYQQAGLNWYHTHIHGSTADDVYKGLAGLFIIDDDNSAALDAAGLPSTYGIDDIPLIIQDKKFVNQVMDVGNLGGRFAGDTFLVNGVVSPNRNVEAGLIRFRILNASNARFYDLSITNNSITGSFQKIATEGGFLAAPATISSLSMGPGERNEIVIDFSAYAVGDVVSLESVDNENTGLVSFTIMTFTVTEQTLATSGNSVPATLNGNLATDRTTLLAKIPNAYVAVDLKGGPNPFASSRDTGTTVATVDIPFTMATANFVSTSTQSIANYTEQWTITGARHPFHLHGCHAMIKSIGGDTNVPAELQGWKDVFKVDNGSDVVFIVQFDEKARALGTAHTDPGAGSNFMYMMHCHILGHEDAGMMGTFEVI